MGTEFTNSSQFHTFSTLSTLISFKMASTTTCVTGLPTLAARNTNRSVRQQRTAQRQAARPTRSLRVCATSATPEPPAPDTKALSFGDMMNFGGVAPELVNGRSAMVAFVAAAGAELATGETVVQQFNDNPVAVLDFIGLTALATFAPQVRGGSMKPEDSWKQLQTDNMFTNPIAIEKINGRAAMLGLVALVVLERSGSAFF